MKTIRGRGFAGLLVALVLLAGCRADSGTQEPTEVRTDSRLEPAMVRVEVDGAHEIVWVGRAQLRIARVGALTEAVNLLSVGIERPQLTDDPALRLRWAFDLLGAYDNKPGKFRIEMAPDPQGLRSMALLIMMRVKEEARKVRDVHDWGDVVFLDEFVVLGQPCTLEVGEGERSGSLVCPELRTADGDKRVALRVHWDEQI